MLFFNTFHKTLSLLLFYSTLFLSKVIVRKNETFDDYKILVDESIKNNESGERHHK